MLDKLEKAYAQGDKAALWQALIHCARWKEPLPRWVSDALEIANLKNLLGDLGSFNNVFGRPNTKGKAEQLKRDHYYALEIAHLADRAEPKVSQETRSGSLRLERPSRAPSSENRKSSNC